MMNSKFVTWCRTYISIAGLAVLAAIVYMIFFQENSMARIYAYRQTIDSLQQEIKVNNDSMLFYLRLNEGMNHQDPEIVERVVRENFNMSLPNEDVYVYR